MTLELVTPRLPPMKGSSIASVAGKRPGVLPGRVQTMSATPSRAWSKSWGGAPPSCIEGKMSILMRLPEASCTLRDQGSRKRWWAFETGGRK